MTLVDSEGYFFTVIRYIHQNPVKVGLCKRVEDYTYSSYLEYLGAGVIADREYVLQLCTVEEFVGMNRENVDANCMDLSDRVVKRVTDEQAKALIKKIAKCESTADFQRLETVKRDKYLKALKEKGVSIRQLSRLTGVSFSVVRKV